VNLLDNTGSVVATTTTDGSGLYQFNNLIPGDYEVQVLKGGFDNYSPQNQGTDDTVDSDADGTTGRMGLTTLTSGENDITWDGGLYSGASLGDRVWHDLDADGIQDAGETGIQGVTVNLYDGDNNLVATTQTDASGDYLFDQLTPGDYHVEVVKPGGYDQFSPQDQGGDDAVDSDTNAAGVMAQTTLLSGESDLTWDGGLFQYASVGDYVWNDADADGIQDAGETGLEGVTVNLYQADGTLLGTTQTDTAGLYLFDQLLPGDYYLEFLPLEGFVFSVEDAIADEQLDSDADIVTGLTNVFTLISGQHDMSWDAGMHEPSEPPIPEPTTVALIGLGLIGIQLAASRGGRRCF
jgi:protocatechuate 3,4-dioxygenase beta subunit